MSAGMKGLVVIGVAFGAGWYFGKKSAAKGR